MQCSVNVEGWFCLRCAVAKLPTPNEEAACLVDMKVFENPGVVFHCPSCCKANFSYSNLKAVVRERLQRQIEMLTEAVTGAFPSQCGQMLALMLAQSSVQCSQEYGQHNTVLLELGKVSPETGNGRYSTFDNKSFMVQMRKMVYQAMSEQKLIDEKAMRTVLLGLPKPEDNAGNFELAIAHAVCSEGGLVVDWLVANRHGIQRH